MDDQDFNEINESLDNLVATIAGYKAKLINAGFCPENAEYMALEFHSLYLQNHMEILAEAVEEDEDK